MSTTIERGRPRPDERVPGRPFLPASGPPAEPGIDALLEQGLHPRRRRADLRRVEELRSAFWKWRAEGSEQGLAGPAAARLAFLIGRRARAHAERIVELHERFDTFSARHARSADPAEGLELLLDYARELGASERQIRGDRRAMRRWFGYDTLVERYRRRVAREEQSLRFALDRLGVAAGASLAGHGDPATLPALWRRLGVEEAAARAMDNAADPRVHAAAFACLGASLRGLAPALQATLPGETMLRRIYRAAMEGRGDAWSQVEALNLLPIVSPELFDDALALRLGSARGGDDLFVRRKLVDLLCARLEKRPDLRELLAAVRRDPSPAVRQALAFGLKQVPAAVLAEELPRLASDDAAPEVRAAALTTLPEILDRADRDWLADLLSVSLRPDTPSFVARTALAVADRTAGRLVEQDPEAGRAWFERLLPAIERLHMEAPALNLRRWAAQTRERLWVRVDPESRSLAHGWAEAAGGLAPGRSRSVPRGRRPLLREPETVGRVLSALAQADFGFDVRTRGPLPRVTRGERFRFRLWRALHEFRHPSTDKRQAFRHTIGRVFYGDLSAPSAILAELAQTKVPGEPLHMPDEAGWRPYLPLPDHALSAIDTGRTVRICTSEGVTLMEPPRGLARRLRARSRLVWSFARFADLRNWTEQRNQPPSAYLRALEELGFGFEFRPYAFPGGRSASVDPSVARFFPAVAAWPLPDAATWDRFESYFFSIYQNSLQHLALFLGAVTAWFFGRHIYLNLLLRRARRGIPLVLGGWGTRGKSGTERLKAAVINALGYGFVSKTTGCEAMFLYADPFGAVREMFLFRPYDKATIWEQFNLTRLTRRLGADVLLWECMGLTPSYVRVLQRHWMRDDVSTITNTYPDHEDLQGPAGRDIPEVMTNFIPARGTLATSEEQMRPILEQAARRLGTRVIPVTWLEAGLLPSDMLRRFPYEEHPYNIALTLAVADELGVDRDFALKEMADRVVPDLGVLKAYPEAPVRTRRLEFVNGMSANERFGTLSNWTRMAFDRQDPEREPGVWITTVVNNRADRVPRSRVFASILVNDVSADRHFLIGSNLEGLQGYVEEAWRDYAATLTLTPPTENGQPGNPLATLEAAARWQRVPRDREQVERILRAMLEGQAERLDVGGLAPLVDDPDALKARLEAEGVAEAAAIAANLLEARSLADEYQAFLAKVRSGPEPTRLNGEFAELLGRWFRRKIVVVENFHATGNEVVERVVAETPPGFRNRVMGIQNIKGTGLDFVYRWQAWDGCHRMCQLARNEDPAEMVAGVRGLAAFQEHGVLTEEYVRATVAQLRDRPAAQNDAVGPQLDAILANLDRSMAEIREKGTAVNKGSGASARLLAGIEAFLDAGDAVRRRRRAERIYRDMEAERISHERAAIELKKLNARQKGGWLGDDLRRMTLRVRRALALSLSFLRRPAER